MPGSLAPGRSDITAKDVTGVACITNSDKAFLNEVETYHVDKISIGWVPQHGLELTGCPGCGDVVVAETFKGVQSFYDAMTIMDCSKKLSQRDGLFCCHVILKDSVLPCLKFIVWLRNFTVNCMA